jgi:phage antirepressor YoqD-like protein
MQLVTTTNDGQPVTTSLAIAQGTDNEHRAVLQLVRKYLADLEEFGRVAFEMRTFETAGGPQQREVAILNERQATLLLSYMRNSEIVREFKKELVREFYRMAEELRQRPSFYIPQTLSEALQLAADQAKQIEHQERQIEAAKPAVEYHERVAVADDCHSIDEAAKILKAGPRKLRQWMRDNKIFRIDGLPGQEYMNRGYFRVIEKTIPLPFGHKLHKQVLVTGKGMQFLQRKIDRHLMGQEV